MRYAASTSVSVEKSKAEIERTLIRYGAAQFATGWNGQSATIGFSMTKRFIRFILPLPDKAEKRYHTTPTGRVRRNLNEETSYKAWEQDCRQRWRALGLVIKAKLEAVEAGITSFEEEFMAHIVLPGGRTVAETVLPNIAAAYESGKPLQLMKGY